MILNDPILDYLTVSTDPENAKISYQLHVPILSSKATPKGHAAHSTALYIWDPITKKVTRTFDLTTGMFAGEFAFDLGTFETINGDQWAGRQPFELKSRPNLKANMPMTTLDTAPPLWEVATINVRTGERIVVLKTHAKKDEAFKIGNRFNIIADYGRALLEPWEDELRAGQKIPPDELAEALAQMPPDFAFGKGTPPAKTSNPKSPSTHPFTVKETQASAEHEPNMKMILIILGLLIGGLIFLSQV